MADLKIYNGDLDGTVKIDGVAMTSTAAELNLLDGVSGLVQADFTKLAAVDATAAEIDLLDAGTAGSSVTLADGDALIIGDADDSNASKKALLSDVATYIAAKQSFDTAEEIQDAMGAMFSSNTETGITATYQDGDGTVDLVVGGVTVAMLDAGAVTIESEGIGNNDSDTQLPTSAAVKDYVDTSITNGKRTQEEVEDFAGALVATGGTKTGITVTYDDANGNMDFVVDTSALTETLTNKTLTAPKFANGGFLADSGGLEVLVFGTAGSAVNQFKMFNAATGNGVTLSADGDDANIDVNLKTKGSGKIQVQSPSTDVSANDVVGHIGFIAPSEGTGTDAVLECGYIRSVAVENFAADKNHARLEFGTGNTAAADTKLMLGSDSSLEFMGSDGKMWGPQGSGSDGAGAPLLLGGGTPTGDAAVGDVWLCSDIAAGSSGNTRNQGSRRGRIKALGADASLKGYDASGNVTWAIANSGAVTGLAGVAVGGALSGVTTMNKTAMVGSAFDIDNQSVGIKAVTHGMTLTAGECIVQVFDPSGNLINAPVAFTSASQLSVDLTNAPALDNYTMSIIKTNAH